jgi:hypothetical protein
VATDRSFVFFSAQQTVLAGRHPHARFSHFLVGLALMALPLVPAWYVVHCWRNEQALTADPVVVQGTVLRLWTTTGKGAANHVEYRFELPSEGGVLFVQREDPVDDAHFAPLHVDGPIDVLYCRTDPSIHHVIGDRSMRFADGRSAVAMLVIVAVMMLPGAAMIWEWWSARRSPPDVAIMVVDGKVERIL